MNYGLELLTKIGAPIEDCSNLLKMLEGPCDECPFETFRAFVFPKEGIEFAFDQNAKLVSVHLFSDGLDGKTEYHRELPFDVAFGDRRIDVANKFGIALEASGGGHQWEGTEVPYWDRYCISDALIHFQYSRVDGGVELITLMAKK